MSPPALDPDSPSATYRIFRRWYAFVAILLIGALLSILAFAVARRADDARVDKSLRSQTEWRARDLEYKLRFATYPAEVLAPLIAAQDSFNPQLFRRFVQLAHQPGDTVDALLWAPLVRHDDRDAFVAAARRNGAPNYDILDLTVSGATAPAASRHAYLPIWLGEAFGGAGLTLGFDLFFLPDRRLWAEEARDTGQPVAAPYKSVLNNTGIASFLVYVPVYSTARPPANITERRAAFRGLIVGRYRIAPLLATAIRGTPPITERIDFLLSSDQPGIAPFQLASYDPDAKQFAEAMPAKLHAGDLDLMNEFDLFGRHWMLVSHFATAQVAALRSSAPFALLGLGLLLTALVALYIQRERGRRFDIEAMVAARTADLSRTVDELAAANRDRQRAEERLVQAQKMEAIGNLTGGLAHDFNNLLGIIIGNLDLLRGLLGTQREADELARDALDGATRGADLTRRLLAFARRQPLQPQRVELNELVGGMAKLLSRTLGETINVALDLAPDVWQAMVDPAQLEASLANLATNARDAMPDGGKLTIVTANRHLDADYCAQYPDVAPGDYAMIEVSDTGTGMPPDVIDRIFEPFFTTKPQDKGTGLGLSMVFGFIKQSGGHVNVYSEMGVGTTFRLYLPRAASSGPSRCRAKAKVSPPDAARSYSRSKTTRRCVGSSCANSVISAIACWKPTMRQPRLRSSIAKRSISSSPT